VAIRKSAPKTHVVIVDTNALWHKDKSHAVSPEFDKAWDECCSLAPLELVIPQTTRDELMFQQTSSAWKRLDTVNDNLRELSGITAKSHKTRIERDVLKSQVEQKVDRWIRARKATVVEVPVAEINWKQLCSEAVWRIPPFTSDPKNPDLEKGFRDALIMATVTSVASKEKRDVNLVFITQDGLLRRTTEQHLKSDQRFSAYEDIGGFASYVKLTKEKLDNAFIRDILTRASEKFFTSDDPTCLYLRENLGERIRKNFADFFTDPERSDKSAIKMTSDTALLGPWSPVDAGRWWISQPEFVSLEPERIYHWKSRVNFARGYRRATQWAVTTPPPGTVNVWNERILYLPFDVMWKALVKADARFYDVKLGEIQLKDNVFRMPYEEERAYFGLAQPSAG
jgi:hypothetical protein